MNEERAIEGEREKENTKEQRENRYADEEQMQCVVLNWRFYSMHFLYHWNFVFGNLVLFRCLFHIQFLLPDLQNVCVCVHTFVHLQDCLFT